MKFNPLFTAAMFLTVSSPAQVLISGYLANPAGTDSPYEYVQLVAAQGIDFSTSPMSVVFASNGAGTANGWTEGGNITYKFNLTSGTLSAGDVFYVGGSGKLINGAGSLDISGQNWIRTITAGTVPVDAVFFGTGVGTALVSAGTAGYQLPVNDLYAGGKLQTTSAIFADPASAAYTKLTGTYDPSAGIWTTTRTAALVPSPTTLPSIASAITVPEPSALALAGLAAVAWIGHRRRK